MRILLRVFLACFVLVLLALGALAIALPRIIGSPAVRERLQNAAEQSVGREVRWEELSFGLLPPRLVVHRPSVAGARSGEPALLEAEGVGLQLELAPLLARTLVIDSLVVEGATLRLVRTKDGIELPRPASASEPSETAPPAEGGAPAAGAGLRLAVRELALRKTRVLLEDRSVSPTVSWELKDLDARGEAKSLEDPIDFQASGELGSGGKLRASGRLTLGGPMDAKLDLESVVLAPVAPYLGKGRALGGKLSGRLHARGDSPVPGQLEADLALDGGDVRLDELLLRGRLTVRADLKGLPGSPAGSFQIDATQAEVAYGEVFRKPSGTSGTVSGQFVPQPDGSVGIDDVRLKVRNLDAEASVRTGKRLRAAVRAAPFDVGGWEEMVPALAAGRLAGRVGIEKLDVTTEPLDLRGRMQVEGLRVRPADQPELVLDGTFDAEGGAALRTRDLRIVTEGQTLNVQGEVSGLDTKPRYDVKVRAEAADTNRLLSGFTSVKETLYGPLTLDGSFTGPLGGGQDLVSALRGRTRLDIGNGRLKGVSLLRSTFERMGALGEAALLAGALRGGSTLQRFYDDEFKSISGGFELGAGQARTDDLRIVYRSYTVDLRGALGMADRRIDATGQLTIDEEVDRALSQEAGAGSAGRRKVIPLAHVTGTLSSPRIDLSPQAVVAFAASYSLARRVEKIDEVERKLDEKLGEGTGKAARDLLEGLLGGGSKR